MFEDFEMNEDGKTFDCHICGEQGIISLGEVEAHQVYCVSVEAEDEDTE